MSYMGFPLRAPQIYAAHSWNFILPTQRGLGTARRELLPDGVIVVVNGAIEWTRKNHADIWATDAIAREVGRFPPRLSVWGPVESMPAFRRAAIPFLPMPTNVVIGPKGVPREADAFFKALGLAIDHMQAKLVRVFGSFDWRRADVRWKRAGLARMIQEAGKSGVEIQRVR